MIQPETFVGSLAIAMALGIGFSALGSIESFQMLRSVKRIGHRYGNSGVRVFLALIAILLFSAGVMILRDVRPSFAEPSIGNSGSHRMLSAERHRH